MKRIYLSSPHMGGHELDYVNDAFDKNWIAPLGENVNKFEKDLQEYTGRKQAAVVTSGTAAIHLGLILCGVKPGDEVICQSFTFAASANPIVYQGATPVFVDSESDTWNMDPDLLEEAIISRLQVDDEDKFPADPLTTDAPAGSSANPAPVRQTVSGGQTKLPKAIVVVHLYGMPAKMDRILQIAAKYDIPVIEDAAESLGSVYKDRKCGSLGNLSVLSFNGNKIITTSGGGALLGDDEKLIQKSRFLATQARDDAPHYQHSEVGYNYRMSNIVAGIGRGQMKVLDERVEARRANHQFYFDNLGKSWLQDSMKEKMNGVSPTGIYFLKEPEDVYSNRWLTAVIVNPDEMGGITREDIRIELEKENIECRPLWKPMHMQPLYESYPFYGNGVSEMLFEYGLCLPSGSNMTDEDRNRVLKAIKKVLGGS